MGGEAERTMRVICNLIPKLFLCFPNRDIHNIFMYISCGMAFFFVPRNYELTFVNKSMTVTAEIPTKRSKFMVVVQCFAECFDALAL